MKTKITSGRMFELTFQTFGLHFNYIISLAAIFIAITFFLGFWAESFNEAEPDMAGALLFMALLVAVYAKLAVMIHRLVILGEKGIGLVFSWSLKELKFIGWILMFVAAAYAVLFVLLQLLAKMLISSGTGMMTLVTLLIIIGLGALFSRVALVFPAAAADHRSSVKHAWELSANNKLSLFFLVVVVPYITGRILDRLPDDQLIWVLLGGVISVFVLIFEVALLSHCYEALIGTDDAETEDDLNVETITEEI